MTINIFSGYFHVLQGLHAFLHPKRTHTLTTGLQKQPLGPSLQKTRDSRKRRTATANEGLKGVKESRRGSAGVTKRDWNLRETPNVLKKHI